MKRRISLIGMIVLCILAASAFAPEQAQAADRSLTETRGVYWYDPHETGIDLTDTYIYDDALLRGDSLPYNQRLATMSYELAVTSISSERTNDYSIKSQNLRAYLEDNGFTGFDTNEDYKKKMTAETIGVACAHKKIRDGGKAYTVLAIVPRSAGYELEWQGNFATGPSGDHSAFEAAAGKVLTFAGSYIQQHGITGDIKVWMPGYSRGAGVTSLAAKAIIDDARAALGLGEGTRLELKNFYCYCYGTPRAADMTGEDYGNPKYDYIHNTFDRFDLVTNLPPEGLGLGRYGTETPAAGDMADYDRVLRFFREMNPVLYNSYVRGGDPNEFTPMKIDTAALTDGKLSFAPDDAPYFKEKTQEEFLGLVADAITAASGGSREVFHETYAGPVGRLAGYYFTHTKQAGEMGTAIMGSKFAIPAAVGMFLSYNADRYADQQISDSAYTELKEALTELQARIAELEDGPEKTQLTEQYREIAEKIEQKENFGSYADAAWTITAGLYGLALAEGLEASGASQEQIDQLTGPDDSKAMCRLLAYVLLYDAQQTEGFSFDYLNQEFRHLATFLGNSGRYMQPHHNEYILSWLKVKDPAYDNMVKENAAQTAGYRRVYIDQPKGSDVTALVKNSKGKSIARLRNGALVSSTDPWVAVTSSDGGGWLRLPANETYTVDLSVSRAAALSLRVTEYSVYEGREVRKVTRDRNYNWQKMTVNAGEKVTLHVAGIKASGGTYKLASSAYYYISKGKPVIVAKGTASGQKAIRISWNKVSGADRYVIYMTRCDTGKEKRVTKKVKVISGNRTSWKKTRLKKKTAYKFKVVAQKKQNGKYVTLATSKLGHVITGNVWKTCTNPKKLKLKKSSFSMTKGKKVTIRATVTKAKAGKKLLTHAKRLRFTSDNPAVASVNAKGVVTAKGKGSCRIYVQAVSGLWKTVKVTVR